MRLLTTVAVLAAIVAACLADGGVYCKKNKECREHFGSNWRCHNKKHICVKKNKDNNNNNIATVSTIGVPCSKDKQCENLLDFRYRCHNKKDVCVVRGKYRYFTNIPCSRTSECRNWFDSNIWRCHNGKGVCVVRGKFRDDFDDNGGLDGMMGGGGSNNFGGNGGDGGDGDDSDGDDGNNGGTGGTGGTGGNGGTGGGGNGGTGGSCPSIIVIVGDSAVEVCLGASVDVNDFTVDVDEFGIVTVTTPLGVANVFQTSNVDVDGGGIQDVVNTGLGIIG